MPLKLRKLTERSEGTTESKSAIRSKMSEGTRESKAIKGTRRSDGTKEVEGVKQGEKNLIRGHFKQIGMYESPFQFGLFFSVSIPRKVSN